MHCTLGQSVTHSLILIVANMQHYLNTFLAHHDAQEAVVPGKVHTRQVR